MNHTPKKKLVCDKENVGVDCQCPYCIDEQAENEAFWAEMGEK